MKNHLTSAFFGLGNHDAFITGIKQAVISINGAQGIYTGDNLFTYHRNLSFLDDKPFMNAFDLHTSNEIERSVLWRMSVVL